VGMSVEEFEPGELLVDGGMPGEEQLREVHDSFLP
jgi:hypothetical protein